MRSVDASGRETCAFQGRVFVRSAALLTDCGSAVFARRFMRSPCARRVDENGAFDMGATEDAVVREVDEEYASRPYGSVVYASEVLYWMGYTYRYWCMATGMSSKRAHAVCGAREMRGLYLAYHALDPEQCVERILESKGLSADSESDEEISRRVMESLRRLRSVNGW